MESDLLDSDSTDEFSHCVLVSSKTVADYTEGEEVIEEHVEIPFTCTVYEKVLVNFDKVDIGYGVVRVLNQV